MEVGVSKIVVELIKVARLNQVKFAKAVKVSQGTVSKWISGEQSPNKTQWDRVTELALNYPEMRPLVVPRIENVSRPPAQIRTIVGGVARPASGPRGTVREIEVRGGMGGGGVTSREVRVRGKHADAFKPESWGFPASFMREELRAPADRVVVIETQGDSMFPTLSPGDRVLVDTGHVLPTPDGIYALRDRWGAMNVKRLQLLRKGDPPRILIISDNESHTTEEVGADEIEIVGRVICCVRRL